MDKETVNALYEERIALLTDASEFKPVKRTPTHSNMSTWMVFNSDLNVPLIDAYADYDIMEKITRETQERYNFDSAGSGAVYNTIANKTLKNTGYIISPEGVNFTDRVLIEDDDLIEYHKDPTTYVWTHVGPKFYSHVTYEDAKKVINAIMAQFAYNMKMENIFINEYGCPSIMNGPNSIQHPMEVFYFTRGLKNLGLDMRRRPEVLLECVEMHTDSFLAIVKGFYEKPTPKNYIYDSMSTLLNHSILSHKQFEKFYWPFCKKYYDLTVEYGKKDLIYWEAEAIRLADFFADYPKGNIAIFPEMEDVRDVRKAFPNMVVVGGMPLDYLKSKSKQECIDKAKELIDTMGEGYIFSENKMLTYKNDCKRENLIAVQDFVHNYYH